MTDSTPLPTSSKPAAIAVPRLAPLQLNAAQRSVLLALCELATPEPQTSTYALYVAERANIPLQSLYKHLTILRDQELIVWQSATRALRRTRRFTVDDTLQYVVLF